MKTVLVTGAGYIGSYTVVALQAEFPVVVFDNLCNGHSEALRLVERVIGQSVPFVEGDIRDVETLDALFQEHNIIKACTPITGAGRWIIRMATLGAKWL